MRALGATAALLGVFSAGFLGGIEIAVGAFVLLCGLAVALYAGVEGGGLLAAQLAVFGSVCWRAVFPPLVGYLRWDDAARYTTTRWTHLYLGPEGELTRGIELGLIYGVLAAVVLGSAAYGVGALYRFLRRDDPSTHPYVE